jgi:hypothetical protein
LQLQLDTGGDLLTLLANGRDGLEFFCLQGPERKRITPCIKGSQVCGLRAPEGSCIGSSAAMGTDSGEGSLT